MEPGVGSGVAEALGVGVEVVELVGLVELVELVDVEVGVKVVYKKMYSAVDSILPGPVKVAVSPAMMPPDCTVPKTVVVAGVLQEPWHIKKV